MEYKTIADVYLANEKILSQFVDTVKGLTDEQLSLPTENGKWTVQMLVEHVAIVHRGITGICARLLSTAEAEGKTSDGGLSPTSAFLEAIANSREEKFEAPDAVAPKGGRSTADSLAVLETASENLDALHSNFESIDGTAGFFPHPKFGPINSHDWLILSGGHVARHHAQLLQILDNN